MTDEQLVYVTILDMVPQTASISIKFRYATSSKETDHCWSKDKDKHDHCYGQLEIGQTYVIVESKVSKARWIWKSCRLVSVAQARKIHSMCGFHPEYETFKEAMLWLKSVQFPKKAPPPPSLCDELVKW